MGHLWLAAEVRALENRVRGKSSLSPYLVLNADALTKHIPLVKHLVSSRKFIIVIPSAGIYFLFPDSLINLIITVFSGFCFGRYETRKFGRKGRDPLARVAVPTGQPLFPFTATSRTGPNPLYKVPKEEGPGDAVLHTGDRVLPLSRPAAEERQQLGHTARRERYRAKQGVQLHRVGRVCWNNFAVDNRVLQ